jgi:MYXO-CTERM domain-containing protein
VAERWTGFISSLRRGREKHADLQDLNRLGGGADRLRLAPGQSGVLVNFNGGATDFTNNFSQNHDGTVTTDLKFGAASGVKDQPGPAAGGGVFITGGVAIDTSAIYTPTLWTLPDGLPHTVSTFVTVTSGLASGDKQLQMGFINGTSSSFNGENPPNASFPNLQPTGFITARFLGNNNVELQTKNIGAGTASAGNLASTGLNVGDWVKLTLTVTETDTTAGTFNWAYTLEDFGPDGLTPPATPANSNSGTVTVAGLANQNLYAGFRTATPATFTGTINFDNFQTVGNGVAAPEPAGLALLGLAIPLLRRRRS